MRREHNFLNRMLQLKLENNDLLLFITMFCSLEGKVRMKKIYFCTCSFPEIKNLNKNSIFYLLSSRRQSSNDFFISSFPDGRNLIKNNSVFFPRSLLECKVQKHFCTWSFKKKREGVLPSPSQKAKFKWNKFFPRSFPWSHSPDKKRFVLTCSLTEVQVQSIISVSLPRRIVHAAEDEMAFHCQDCGKRYPARAKRDFENHCKTHTGAEHTPELFPVPVPVPTIS